MTDNSGFRLSLSSWPISTIDQCIGPMNNITIVNFYLGEIIDTRLYLF